MATYGKPTTSFYVNYGELTPGVAQRALAPCLIAPRYKLHRTTGGFNGTFVTQFPLDSELIGTVLPWPDKQEEGSVVDTDSVQVAARNVWLKLNNEAMAGTVDSVSTNCVILNDSVKYLEGLTGLAPELGAVEIFPGDRIKLTTTVAEGTQTVIDAEVVDIQPTMSDPEINIVATADGIDSESLVAGGEFIGSTAVSYLVTVISVSDTAASVEVTALLGDNGYFNKLELNADSETVVGEFGLTLKLGATSPAAGNSFILSASPAKAAKFNKVFVSADIENAGASVSVDFSTRRLSPTETILTTSAWDLAAGGITLSDNIMVAVGGKRYNVTAADIHVTYRELLTEDVMELRSNQTANIADWVGPIDPDNPMGMMYAAAAQVADAFFYVMASNDTEESVIQCVNYVAQFEPVYASIPYMQTPRTQNAVAAMIQKYSDPLIAQFKHGWFCTTKSKNADVYSANVDGAALVGSISAKGELTLVGDVDVIGNKVKAGDLVNVIGGYSDVLGKFTETAYAVEHIVNKNTVKLKNAKACGMTRVYFSRKLNGAEWAESLANEARAINNSRINFVAADELSFMGYSNVSPAYLCATLAAMRCALAPHAPMNELVVPGFSVSDTCKWTDVEYDMMNAGGVWVVARNAEGELVTYHQITTRTDGTIAEEDSVVSNGDEIVRRLRIAVRPYASGKSNVTDALLNKIKATITAELVQIQSDYYPDIYGRRILSFSIDQLYIPAGNKRSLVCSLRIELPQPLQGGRFIFNLF